MRCSRPHPDGARRSTAAIRLSNRTACRETGINQQCEDLDLGFVDAAVVAIAEALRVRRIATTDLRHFAPLAARCSLELLP
jgi:hypothetical protein